ncbi:hypothetical protein XENTR_v10018831 [Xenopus tropicalis]|uniref:Beta,beta-carotene 9',10'-oxygenase n=1 Tax=Xenopus tropicalis TaxID=8364 RepID=A0A6I8R1T0_XENTR|nr:beta,beta-carotene 9',10'-oxygenase [Xenopus tropicalis]KAE8592642.1 hypothetical protein XENTR_v10018831 [Xenopus tropicalis]
MDFITSVIHNIPVLKNYFNEEKKQLSYTGRTNLECIAPLFQTVEETPQPIPTQIIGTVPSWIKGSFLRNGPGKFEFGEDKFNHWFDGMALMHKFTIENGNVTYMSRFLESDSYKTNHSENRIAVSEFGTTAMPDPCKSIFYRFLSRFEMPNPTDNGSINFMKYQNDYYVSTETNLMHKVNSDLLVTKEKVDWSKYVAVNGATAHPHYDPDGTTYNMGNSYGKQGTHYNIIKIPATGPETEGTLQGVQIVCCIPAKNTMRPSYYHSFGMTENYIIFVEQPIKINVLRILTSNLSGASIADSITWDPSCDTVFHVANKHTGELHPVTFHALPFGMFHQINAYEDKGCIVFDLCSLKDGKILSVYQLQNLHKAGQALDQVYNSAARSFPCRYVLPLNTDSNTPQDRNLISLSYTTATATNRADGTVWCTPESLYDTTMEEQGGLEFPAINYSKYNTKKYRYFYGCGFQHLIGSSLIKVDIQTKKLKIWQEEGFYPSEPVFVSSPDLKEEDSGVILSVVVTPHQEKSTFLLILDAKTFAEIGRAEVPVHMPYGFHGIFVDQGS